MIDVGRYGKADSPFASFEEVIDDLEQMSLYPQVFLYDAGKCLSLSSSLLFGQRHYGRVSEVTKILEISTMMEQSAKDGCDDGSAEIVYISGIAGMPWGLEFAYHPFVLVLIMWYVLLSFRLAPLNPNDCREWKNTPCTQSWKLFIKSGVDSH